MKYTIFGESHGPAIGVVLEGVPAGLALDLEAMRKDLSRRSTGKDALSTARKEADEVNVLSGVFEGRTTGAPLALVIANSDQHSGDYEALREKHRAMGCICFENHDMGIYFIEDPDGYWIELVPERG